MTTIRGFNFECKIDIPDKEILYDDFILIIKKNIPSKFIHYVLIDDYTNPNKHEYIYTSYCDNLFSKPEFIIPDKLTLISLNYDDKK